MNLDDMLKEASVVDHSWYTDDTGLGRTGEPSVDEIVERSKNPNNIKPALEIEWGTAGPDVDIDEPAGTVKRNIPDDALGDAEGVILFARDQMNRGRMGRELAAAMKARFDQGTLRKAADGLREMFKLEGLVGCVVVDARGYKSCRHAMKAAEASPYKRFIKRVIGCRCGDPHLLPDGRRIEGAIPGTTGGAVDDFLASYDSGAPAAMVSHCRSTMLPLIGQDIDESELDDTLVDVMSITGLPEDEVKGLRDDRHNDKYGRNLGVLQAAFRAVARLAEDGLVAEQAVAGQDFRLVAADNEIELEEPIPTGVIDVDEGVASIELEPSDSVPVDVEMEQFKESEFEGIDEVDLDSEKDIPEELDVERGGCLTI